MHCKKRRQEIQTIQFVDNQFIVLIVFLVFNIKNLLLWLLAEVVGVEGAFGVGLGKGDVAR